MRQFKYLLLSVIIFAPTAPIHAQNKYACSSDHVVTIHGTSNLHDWDETVKTVTGDGAISWNGDGSFDMNAVGIKMDVHSIKSNEGSIMNNNTYKALKADNYPEILFALVTPIRAIPVNVNKRALQARITLTIAGVTRTMDMTVLATAQGKGKITFEGTKTIKMTDFNVKPPVALLGTLKTGDDITIHFKTDFVASN